MRVPVLAALTFTLLSCTQSFSLPDGAQLRCDAENACPVPLLCDPELSLCVDTIVASPRLMVSVDRPEGSRSDLFTFTASSPEPAGLRYRWELLDDATGDARVLAETESNTLIQRFQVSRDEFCPGGACRTALPRTVRVTATNAGGKSADRQVTVVIKNTPPTANFGEDLFVSEDGVPEVELDICGGVRADGGCTSRDEDGDPLEFSGFNDAGVVLRDAGPGRVRFTPPTNWQRPLIFTGVVSDGIESSTGTVRVFRGSHVWVNAGLVDQNWRIHPDFRAVTSWTRGAASPAFYSPEALVSDGTGGWWFGDSDGTVPAGQGATFVVHLDRTLTEVERWEVPNNSSAGSAAVPSLVPPRGAVPGCMVFRQVSSGGPASGFVRFTAGQAQTTLKHTRPQPDGGASLPLGVLPVGASGDCWAIGQGSAGAVGFNSLGGELGKLDQNANWVPVAQLSGYPHAWTAEADGTLWLAERFPIPTADGGFAPPIQNRYRTEVRRWSPQGVPTTIDVPGRFVTQMTAHPAGGVWALDATSRALVRIFPDGSSTAATTPPIGGANVFTPSGMAYDDLGHALWVTDALADQLYRFDEAPDGGLTASGLVRPEDLPSGVNRKGFGNPVAIDPVTGAASSFVGAVSSLYARWVTVPPHALRQERASSLIVDLTRLRGDPTSGHEWAASNSSLKRIDVKGRVLLEVPNAFTDEQLFNAVPMVVDRRGRAWVTSSQGMPRLRAIDTEGQESTTIILPFTVITLTLGSTMENGTPREEACGLGPQRLGYPVMRVKLPDGVPQTITVPPNPDGGISQATACAPLSSGRTWLIIDRGDRHIAALYEAGQGASVPSATIDAVLMGGNEVQIIGAAADQTSGELFVTTWIQASYFSDLIRVQQGGTVSTVRALQGPMSLGIGLSVHPRRVCPGPSSSCLELWVPNRLSEIHRFDLQGAEIDGFVYGRAEPVIDLVQ